MLNPSAVRVSADAGLPPEIKTVDDFIDRTLGDLFFVCNNVLRHKKKTMYRDLNWIHLALCDFIDFRKNPVRQKLIIMFRDALKSAIGRGFMVQEFLRAAIYDVEGLEAIVCGRNELGEEHLEFISNEILTNELIQAYFQGFVPTKKDDARKWASGKIRWKKWGIDIGSLKKSLSGKHYLGCWTDNYCDEINTTTRELRKSVVERWQAQESVFAEDAWEFVTETPWEPDDLSGIILDPRGKFDYRKIYRNPCHTFISSTGYAVFSCPARGQDGKPVFPEKVDEAYLQRKKDKQGSRLYNRMYELQPNDEEERLIHTRWMEDYYDFLPKNYVRLLGVDMAGTKAKESSSTGFVDGEWDEHEKVYVRDAWREKIDPMQAFYRICEKWDQAEKDKRPFTYVIVEREKYGIFLEDVFRNLRPDIYAVTLNLKGVPRPRRHHSLQPWFERGDVKMRRNLTEFEEQLAQLKRGDNDDVNADIVDAFFMVIEGRIIPRKNMEPPEEEKPLADPDFKRQVDGDLQAQLSARGLQPGMF